MAVPVILPVGSGVQSFWVLSSPLAKRTLSAKRVIEICISLAHGPEGNQYSEIQLFCNMVEFHNVAHPLVAPENPNEILHPTEWTRVVSWNRREPQKLSNFHPLNVAERVRALLDREGISDDIPDDRTGFIPSENQYKF